MYFHLWSYSPFQHRDTKETACPTKSSAVDKLFGRISLSIHVISPLESDRTLWLDGITVAWFSGNYMDFYLRAKIEVNISLGFN
jgi:hypothetical protein